MEKDYTPNFTHSPEDITQDNLRNLLEDRCDALKPSITLSDLVQVQLNLANLSIRERTIIELLGSTGCRHSELMEIRNFQ